LSLPCAKLCSWLGVVPASNRNTAMTLNTLQIPANSRSDATYLPDTAFELG